MLPVEHGASPVVHTPRHDLLGYGWGSMCIARVPQQHLAIPQGEGAHPRAPSLSHNLLIIRIQMREISPRGIVSRQFFSFTYSNYSDTPHV